jgi:hypothetical protein
MVWAVASAGRTATWLFAALTQSEATSSGLDNAKTVADIVGTLITAVAVIVGAVWAYYRFFKDRTYRPRLEVSMGGEWFTVDGERLLLARVQIKNIGSSVVELLQKGTGLRVSTMAADASESDAPRPVEWVPGRVYKILEEHAWIEPGETVSDDVLLRLAVPAGQPVLFETRLVWKWSGGKHNIVVFARQVVPASEVEGAYDSWREGAVEVVPDEGQAYEDLQAWEEHGQTEAWEEAKPPSVVQPPEYSHDTEPQPYGAGEQVNQAYEDPNETEDWRRAAESPRAAPGEGDQSEADTPSSSDP